MHTEREPNFFLPSSFNLNLRTWQQRNDPIATPITPISTTNQILITLFYHNKIEFLQKSDYTYNMKRNGFTLIEVALVLAIAGIIFAATFIALPGLWASQRDAARRENMMSFVTKLKNFQTNNNRGDLPGSTSSRAGANASTNSDKSIIDGGQAVSISGDAIASDRENKSIYQATSWAGFYRDFINNDFADPNGNYYDLYIARCEKTNSLAIGAACDNRDLANINKLTEPNYTIYVAIGATCEGDTAIRSANNRKIAVIYRLERAGQYCYNS